MSADCQCCLQLLTDGSQQRDHINVSFLIFHGDNEVKAINYLFPRQCCVCLIAEPRCPHGSVTVVNIKAHRLGDTIFKLDANQLTVIEI